MGQDSNIEWTDATWNPVVGCTRASAGCNNCYAVVMSNRQEAMAKADIEQGRDPGRKANYIGLTVLNGKGDRHFNGTVRTVPEALTDPLHWKRPRKVFVNSMSDLFHKDVPFDFIDKVFAVMALCPQHTFQILTKRPERAVEYFKPHETPRPMVTMPGNRKVFAPSHLSHTFTRRDMVVLAASEFLGDNPPRGVMAGMKWPLPNVWLGTSVENQATADERIPHLLRVPAAVRFLSVEPLLGEVNITDQPWWDWRYQYAYYKTVYPHARPPIDWVIVGGESGANARPCNIEWIRSIVGQCKAAQVPVFVKQLGSKPLLDPLAGCEEPVGTKLPEEAWLKLTDRKGGDMSEWPEDVRVRELPKGGAD